MPSTAGTILSAIESRLKILYPDIPVRTSKRAAKGGRAGEGGWTPGYPSTCFVISIGDPETIDSAATFEVVSVTYPVLIEYVKPSMARVENANSGPTTVVEDDDTRTVRAAIRGEFYKSRITGTTVFDVRHKMQGAYEMTGAGLAPLVVSGESFDYTAWEARATS